MLFNGPSALLYGCHSIAVLLVASAAEAQVVGEAVLSAQHIGESRVLKVSRDRNGRTNHVRGYFDVGLGASSDMGSVSVLENATERFVRRNREVFAQPETYQYERLRLSNIQHAAGGDIVLQGYQVFEGLRILSSDLTVVFRPDGRLIMFNGYLVWESDFLVSFDGITAAEALEVALMWIGETEPLPVEPELLEDGRLVWRTSARGEAVSVERIVDPFVGTTAWEIHAPDVVVRHP